MSWLKEVVSYHFTENSWRTCVIILPLWQLPSKLSMLLKHEKVLLISSSSLSAVSHLSLVLLPLPFTLSILGHLLSSKKQNQKSKPSLPMSIDEPLNQSICLHIHFITHRYGHISWTPPPTPHHTHSHTHFLLSVYEQNF